MGSCVSSSHNDRSYSASDSAAKLAALISKSETITTTTSPVKNDVMISGNSLIIDSGRRGSSGNKEEVMFFDSRGWLDSDCEDDFMSVDGEFTPSRGTTPVHHKFSDQSTQKAKTDEIKHEEELSPTDNKKRLLELFKETQEEDEDEEEDDVAEGKARACLWLRTPVRSSAPATPYNINDRERKQLKRVRSEAHGGCILRLVSCSSFTERRRRMMNHTPIDVQR
ncbi:hypothetical protein EUTSA_v10021476mg [Eutrema salsugineum]|uniref:Uncharacterized protein n=1 Tax=Eutrema salsugineum TaxID=72664 RepID=V4M509_EUTSA|nr:uncharacterized protein At3g27210 [Eutrema salsugineum]ESQ50007.1 hypothetical protein EUTSA_v10021476mg [Eutrema salsugineum]